MGDEDGAGVSAEEALRRAREIAARLTGRAARIGGGSSPGATGTAAPGLETRETGIGEAPPGVSESVAAQERKRKRWGVMPDAKTATPAALAVPVASAADSSKRPKPDDDAPDLSVQKRVWVSIDGKPRAHYVRYLTSHFDEILDKARQQLESTGASATNGGEQQKPPLVTLELQGKGASTEPPVPGMPEQPLHVLIRGSSVSAPLAAILVEQALLDAQEAEVSQEDWDSEPPEAAITGDRGAEASNPNNAGAIATLDSYRRSSTYRPASVAQLIGAHGPGSANLPVIGDDQDAVEEEMRVPHSVVGLIIGRGGEAIAALQMRTRCKVQIQKEAELTPGQTLRVIHLRAATQDALDAAKAHIERLVQERAGSGAGGGGGMGSGASKVSSPANAQTAPSNPKDAAAAKVAEAVTAGHAHLQVEVPEADVGLVIGRQGATIRSIQDATGANIQVPPSVPGQSVRLVDITHPMLQGAEAAQRHIQDLLTSRPRTAGVSSGSAAGGAGSGGGHVTIQVPIPDKDVGLCIGRQGAVIRHMQNTTQTRIQIPSQPVPGEVYRIATISGSAGGCQQAKWMIETIVAEQSSVRILSSGGGGPMMMSMGGGGVQSYYGGGQAPQQQQAVGGGDQQAYSAEWAAYHAAQAAAAAASQQQQAAPTPVAQQHQPTQADGTSTYHDQFFRYSYYYGEDAARQYYGAWAPPPGTPNPYGTNPNAIQQPPPSAGNDPAASSETKTTAIDPNDPLFAATVVANGTVAASADATSAPTTEHQQQNLQARETSRRNVSNLPAWMTKG